MNPPSKQQPREVVYDPQRGCGEIDGGAHAADHWKELIVAGNRAYDCGEYRTAQVCYRRACELSCTAFATWVGCDYDSAVAALVVSYLNLADTEVRLCNTDAAAGWLREIHERLLTLFESVHCDAELRAVAFRHANETFLAIAHFQAEHGPRPELAVFGALSRIEH